MTPEELAEIKARHEKANDVLFGDGPEVELAFYMADSLEDVPALVAEVERCWEGLRTGAAERDRLRAELSSFTNREASRPLDGPPPPAFICAQCGDRLVGAEAAVNHVIDDHGVLREVGN